MDQQRFAQALARVREQDKQGGGGIGTLREQSLHAVLKWYFEPYGESHEVRVGRYVADIVGEDGIIEVQTRQLNKLRDKLQAFLDVAPVTVVYPVARVKWITWIDPATGEAVSRRKSPKRGRFPDAFPELYRLRPLLTHPALRIHLLLLDIEDFRMLDGWSYDRKRGSHRCGRIPVALADELVLSCAHDYCAFLPDHLPAPFTSRDYAAASRMRLDHAQTALNILNTVGAVERDGKQGRLYLYRRRAPG